MRQNTKHGHYFVSSISEKIKYVLWLVLPVGHEAKRERRREKLSRGTNVYDYEKHLRATADWEIDIQMPSGAVMGSVVTAKPSPALIPAR